MGNTPPPRPPPPPPPPVVLVPPLFDFPPLSARTRMLETSYDVLFGKLAMKCLFQDYFEKVNYVNSRIMLKPIDDPHVDITATVEGPLDMSNDGLSGNAILRWQGDLDDPNTFLDLFVSNTNPVLRLRACGYLPVNGFGAFGILPLLLKNGSVYDSDYGSMGLRYGSENLSVGATVAPFSSPSELPKKAWLVSKLGRVTVGVQYEPKYWSKDCPRYRNLSNWSCAVGYGVGSGSPLSPSFNFSLELANSSQFTASFYQHLVAQRRVQNPSEKSEVVGITNYIDFGFELQTRINGANKQSDIPDSTSQLAASWQANKNLLVKGKVGPHSESVALAFKSWWKPSFGFNISATRNRMTGETEFGFGINVDNITEASYQRADPNFVMLTPSKEHLAEGIAWKVGREQSNLEAGNFEGVPRELKPMTKIL